MTSSDKPIGSYTIEHAAKTAAICIAAAYGIGLIVSNVFLGGLGASDFAVLRPRLVLVGVTFGLYLALPVSIAILPLLVFRLSRQLGVSTIRSYADAAAATVVAVVLFPAPFDPFIWDVPHYSLVWFWARFWDEVYGTYWQWPHLVLLVVVPCFLLLRARLERTVLRAGLRSSLIFLLVAGIVYQIIPFSGDVYPAIAASVGGGHPRLVEISFQPSFQQSTFGKMPNGYYLLWHETSDSVVLTGANDGPLARTYLIRSDHVLAMVVHDAHVRLRDGAIESVVLHGNGTCDMQQHFAAPPL